MNHKAGCYRLGPARTRPTNGVPSGGRKVKVTHVSSAHRVSDNRVHLRECASLVELGYEVSLVAIEAPEGIILPDTGVDLRTSRPRQRLSRMTVGSIMAVREGLRTRASIYHLHDPELVWAIPILKLSGAKVIYDAHEDLPDQVADKPYIPRRLRLAASWLARSVVQLSKSADHVVAATEHIAERYDPACVSVVKNYPRMSSNQSSVMKIDERREQAVYVGAIGKERGAVTMIRALAEDAFPEGWSLALAGGMSEALRQDLESEPGWGSVEFEGVVSPLAARDLISKSKVGFALLLPTDAYLESLPTKMFEYFAEGVPVIASDFPLWRRIIETHDCGLLVDPSAPSQVARAVARYANDPGLWQRHSDNGRNAVEADLNWASQQEILGEAYARLLNGPGRASCHQMGLRR